MRFLYFLLYIPRFNAVDNDDAEDMVFQEIILAKKPRRKFYNL